MNTIFQIIVIFFTFLFDSIVGNIVTVGNYSQLNNNTCGKSMHSIGVDTNCLKWHKDVISPVKGATNVTLGAAPWMAFLRFSRILANGSEVTDTCSGSVIADEWILTAAHCTVGSFDFEIYLGYNFTNLDPSEQYYYEAVRVMLHPSYDAVNRFNDMALIKLNESIDSSSGDGLHVNSICLPEMWARTHCPTDTIDCSSKEYAMFAGWGPGLHKEPQPLQMGFWRIINYRYALNPQDIDFKSYMMVERVDDKQTICAGDSGGPFWQYDMGRAVIVGILTATWNDDEWLCDAAIPNNQTQEILGMWVDQEIDWIEETIQNN